MIKELPKRNLTPREKWLLKQGIKPLSEEERKEIAKIRLNK
jgi:hypothetical protein